MVGSQDQTSLQRVTSCYCCRLNYFTHHNLKAWLLCWNCKSWCLLMSSFFQDTWCASSDGLHYLSSTCPVERHSPIVVLTSVPQHQWPTGRQRHCLSLSIDRGVWGIYPLLCLCRAAWFCECQEWTCYFEEAIVLHKFFLLGKTNFQSSSGPSTTGEQN